MTCRYYRAEAAELHAGRCRRQPPTVHADTRVSPNAAWPQVAEADWCGDYEAVSSGAAEA